MAHWIRAMLLLTVIGAPGLAQAPSEWKTFTSVDGRFSVRVPGTPKESPDAKKPEDTSPPTHSLLLTYKDSAYILTYTDFPARQADNGNAVTILNAARDGGIKNAKGRLIAEQEITVNGYPGRDIAASVPIDDKPGIAHFRIVLARSRLYMILYVGPGRSAQQPQVDTFLKSFQILPADEPDGWKTFTSTDGKFSVRMPGAPKEKVSDLAGGGGKIHMATLDKGDYAYIVSYNGIADGAPKPDAVPALLNKGRDAMISGIHGKLLEENSLSLAGNPGKAVRAAIPGQKSTAIVRAYIVGDQYYQVMLIAADKALASADANRFFTSFRFDGPGAEPEWTQFSSKDGRFSVDLPGEPKQEKLPNGTFKYHIELGNTAYVIVHVDMTDMVTDPDKITMVLEASKEAELKVFEARALSQKQITLMGAPGLQVTFTIPGTKMPGGGYGIERFYLVGKRIYEVAVLTGDTKAEEAKFARFFASFKVDPQ